MFKEDLKGRESGERPFEGLKIYFSGSIRGIPHPDPNLPWELVQYMVRSGANVLSEHVAARTRDEMFVIFLRKSGIDLGPYTREERAKIARRVDFGWVREASHLIALVDTPSLGVGMEAQEAIRKPQLGFNQTPILFLAHKDTIEADKLSNMITGIDAEEEGVTFEVGEYNSFEDACRIIQSFLTRHK